MKISPQIPMGGVSGVVFQIKEDEKDSQEVQGSPNQVGETRTQRGPGSSMPCLNGNLQRLSFKYNSAGIDGWSSLQLDKLSQSERFFDNLQTKIVDGNLTSHPLFGGLLERISNTFPRFPNHPLSSKAFIGCRQDLRNPTRDKRDADRSFTLWILSWQRRGPRKDVIIRFGLLC